MRQTTDFLIPNNVGAVSVSGNFEDFFLWGKWFVLSVSTEPAVAGACGAAHSEAGQDT